jgi:hypothetical protein
MPPERPREAHTCEPSRVFHIELRQFPHNVCRFNLEQAELFATIVEPWANEQWIEVGERKWRPDQARLTVLEGPRLDMQQLSMGRGWGSATRESEDVTERVLAEARARGARREGAQAGAAGGAGVGPRPATASAAAGSPSPPPAQGTSPEDSLAAVAAGVGPLTQQLRELLGEDPVALLQAWRLAALRRPELSPSECLALAERTLSSLG